MSARSRRDQILVAVAEETARTGLEALEVKQVVERAGVNIQLLYYHFPNRGALLTAALRYAYEHAPSSVNLLEGLGSESGFEALRSSLRAEFSDEPGIRELNVLWNEVSALPDIDADLRTELAEVTRSWDERITVGVLRGMADGSIATSIPPQALAQILTATLEGVSQRWLCGALDTAQAQATMEAVLERIRA